MFFYDFVIDVVVIVVLLIFFVFNFFFDVVVVGVFIDAVVVGMGLNVAWAPDGAAALRVETVSPAQLPCALLEELDAILRDIALAVPRGLVIGSAKASGFIAGADIKEFTTLSSVDEARRLVRAGQSVFDRLEALPCPTVAMIEGFALGGGLELPTEGT